MVIYISCGDFKHRPAENASAFLPLARQLCKNVAHRYAGRNLDRLLPDFAACDVERVYLERLFLENRRERADPNKASVIQTRFCNNKSEVHTVRARANAGGCRTG